jgi:integrase
MRYRWQGKHYSKVCVATTKTGAKAERAKLMDSLAKGAFDPTAAGSGSTLADLASAWLSREKTLAKRSIDTDKRHWPVILAILGPKLPVKSITPATIEALRAGLRQRRNRSGRVGLSAGGVNRYLTLLGAALRYVARELQWQVPRCQITVNRSAERQCERVMTLDEYERLMAVIERADVRCVLTFCFWAGCRAGEVCRLRHADIDFASGTALLRRTKSGRDRTISLEPEMREALAALPVPLDGGRIINVESGDIAAVVRRAVKAAGIAPWQNSRGIPEALTTHCGRRAFVTRAAASGVTQTALMALVGHETPRMTLQYYRPAAETTVALTEQANASLRGDAKELQKKA